MKNKLNIILAGLAGSLVLALPVQAAEPSYNIGADLELDLTSENTSSDSDTDFTHGGRVQISATGEVVKGDAFIRGVGELLINVAGDTVTTDDVYVQFGKGNMDLQIGRYEAANIFPLGRDTYIAWAENGAENYQGNKLRGRASDGAQLAFHYKPSDNMLFEVSTSWGDIVANASDDNAFGGIRPVIVYSGDAFGVAAGLEYLQADEDPANGNGELEQSGASLSFNFDTGEGSVNVNAAYLDQENSFTGGSDKKVTSFGVNYTGSALGLGAIHSMEDANGATDPTTTSLYATYTVPIFDIENASVTFAVSHSFSEDTGGNDDDVTGGRIRFNYVF